MQEAYKSSTRKTRKKEFNFLIETSIKLRKENRGNDSSTHEIKKRTPKVEENMVKLS